MTTGSGQNVRYNVAKEHKQEAGLVRILLLHTEVLVVQEHLQRVRVVTPKAVQVIKSKFIGSQKQPLQCPVRFFNFLC